MTGRDDGALPGSAGLPGWLDSGLARLAFGCRPARDGGMAGQATAHLAFLPHDSLEIDLDDPAEREFGEYELLQQIGQGGMGVVYRARQKRLERDVAVKLLSAAPWASEDFIAAFQREARNAASLQHPNIVAVHEMGEHDGLIFYAMRLVTGESLAQRLAGGEAIAVREAVAMVRTVAEAVDYAHRMGVLHLDLKPGNILLDGDGTVQVTDFGLARRLGQAASLENEQVSGTPSYMAPEQAQVRNARLSAATDIWGLGAVLYELLAGRPPFVGDSPRAILDQVLAAEVVSPGRYARLPRDLEAICLKCLARPADERYASARELADDLDRFLQNRSVRARPLTAWQRLGRWTRREPRLALASATALLALVVGLAAATWQWRRADSSAASARAQTWHTRGEAAWRLVDDGLVLDALPLLLDNLREREASGDAAGAALERLRLGSIRRSGAQLIDAFATGARVGRAVDVDRDGARVAVVDVDEVVRLFSTADGRLLWQAGTRHAAHMRAAGLPPTRVEFSRDGRHLVAATMEPGSFVRPHGRNNVLLDSADGRVLLPPPGVFEDFLDATFGRDGSHALLRARSGGAQLFSVPDWRPLGPMQRFPSLGGSWAVGDEGRFIARATSEGLAIQLLDARQLQARHTLRFEPTRAVAVWAVQPGGDLLALGHRDGVVQLLDAGDASLRPLQSMAGAEVRVLNFSHDGRWLLAAVGKQVYVWEVDSGAGGALPLARPVDAWRVEGDPATGTVFLAGADADDAQLWQLPVAGPARGDLSRRLAAGRPLVTQFGFGPTQNRNAAAFAPAARLVANIERDGELRLWRWHEAGPLDRRGAPMANDELWFDGQHVPVVEGRVAYMVDIEDERPVSPPLVHPQPVSLTIPTADGRALVTVSGRELRMFDWRSGAQRWPAIPLESSPLRVLASPGSGHLLVTTGGYADGGFKEFLTSFDLDRGRVLAGPVALPGPLDGLRCGRDGRRLVHWRGEQGQVRDAVNLRPIGPPVRFGVDVTAFFRAARGPILHAAELGDLTPIVDAALDEGGERLTLIVHGSDPHSPRLAKVDAASGAILREQSLPPGLTPRLWPWRDGHQFSVISVLNGSAQLFDDTGSGRVLRVGRARFGFAQGISADGRWLAQYTSAGVRILDRSSGEWASGPLVLPQAMSAQVAQLAFARDGRRLLARSDAGHWLWWPVSPEELAPQSLARRIGHLRPGLAALHGQGGGPPTGQERESMRADDPGAPVAPAGPAPLRLPATAGPAPRSGLVPVDLGAATELAGLDLASLQWGAFGPLALPSGLQRLSGIDFDLRGPVLLAMPETPRATLDLPAVSQPVAPGHAHFAAVHLLVSGCCVLPTRPDGAYAYLRLVYQDGGHARIPIVHGKDMLPAELNAGDSETPRIAWLDARPRAQGRALRVYAARLANPDPDRAVAALVFEASEHFASGPAIFAATLETAPVTGEETR